MSLASFLPQAPNGRIPMVTPRNYRVATSLVGIRSVIILGESMVEIDALALLDV